jgi:Glycosyl transferase family 11
MPNDRRCSLADYRIQAQFIFQGPPNSKIRGRYSKVEAFLGRHIADRMLALFPRKARIRNHLLRVIEDRRPYVYDQRWATLTGSIYLKGGWQCYRYFENAAEIIRSDLQPKRSPSQLNRAWLERVRRSNSVCVHVRRGDYIQSGLGLCPLSYYTEAATVMRNRVGNPVFFVFSDDLQWCREYFSIDNAVLVDANNSDDPVSELHIMSSCRHHIIANSSFSWWAAWLAESRKQVVIAPQPWVSFAPSVPDLIPPGWMILPYA